MRFVPERLKEIRILNNLTVTQMAELLGITKQAVSKYETGRAIPSRYILDKIIEIFSLPVGYLTKENVLPKQATDIFYRKSQRTSQRELEGVKVRQKWRYELIRACGEIMEMPCSEVPFLEEPHKIEEAALELRRHWGLGEEPVDDMETLLKKHRFYIFTDKMENSKIDGYSQLIDGYGIIVLNVERGSLERKNFSLAHELGHLLLHSQGQNYNISQERLEEEADAFAGSFLMPETAFKKEIIRIDTDQLIRSGERWRVSPHAVLKRCIALGFLEEKKDERDAHVEYLYQRLNKIKNYFVHDAGQVCSLRSILEEADRDEEQRHRLLNHLCFPIKEIQRLCQAEDLFIKEEQAPQTGNIDDMDGIQLSFLL